jgi:hypothetical protein
MARHSKSPQGLADPLRLPAVDSDDAEQLVVIIETPKGSRNKYACDPEERIFALKMVLAAGMAFPYDFGFVPSMSHSPWCQRELTAKAAFMRHTRVLGPPRICLAFRYAAAFPL